MSVRSSRGTALTLFALAASVRVAYLLAARTPFDSPYWLLSDGLLHDGSLSSYGAVATTDFEPLYPIFLVAARRLTGDRLILIQIIQAVVASLAVFPLYRLVEHVTGRWRAAAVAAALFAMYPLLVRHSADGTETALLSVLLVAFAGAFTTTRTYADAAVAGVWLGLAGLTRAVTWPLIVLAPLVARNRRTAAATALVAASVLLPYIVRNLTVNGATAPTRAGVNLFISNNLYTTRLMPTYGPDVLGAYSAEIVAAHGVPLGDGSPASDQNLNAAFRSLTLAEVTAHPLPIAWLKFKNVGYFFAPWLVPLREPAAADVSLVIAPDGGLQVDGMTPRSTFNEAMYVLSYGPVLALALVGIYYRRERLRDDAILWCIVATFAAVHAVFFPTTRYRAPVDFVLMVYAAAAVDVLWERRTRTGGESMIRPEAVG